MAEELEQNGLPLVAWTGAVPGRKFRAVLVEGPWTCRDAGAENPGPPLQVRLGAKLVLEVSRGRDGMGVETWAALPDEALQDGSDKTHMLAELAKGTIFYAGPICSACLDTGYQEHGEMEEIAKGTATPCDKCERGQQVRRRGGR